MKSAFFEILDSLVSGGNVIAEFMKWEVTVEPTEMCCAKLLLGPGQTVIDLRTDLVYFDEEESQVAYFRETRHNGNLAERTCQNSYKRGPNTRKASQLYLLRTFDICLTHC